MLTLDFVINPRARRVHADRLRSRLRRRFAGRRVAFYSDPRDLPDDPHDERVAVAVGGDGTVNRVLNSPNLGARRVAILPLGTSNDLATNLGIPHQADHACETIETGSLRQIDLVDVNGRQLATCGGIGFAVDVAARANAWKSSRSRTVVRAMGPLVYPLAAARQLTARRKDIAATLTVAGVAQEVTLSIAMVSNQRRFGNRFSTSPRARNDDGVLDLALFAPTRGLLGMAHTVTQIYRARPDRCAGVQQLRSATFTLTTDGPVPFFGDGEVLCVSDHFEIRVRPRALRVIGPATTKAGK